MTYEFQFELIRRWVALRDRRARALLAEFFWQIQLLREMGIPKFPELKIPWPPQPQPDPSPFNPHDEVLVKLIDLSVANLRLQPDISSDPEPQPNLAGLLGNRKARLAAAKILVNSFTKATQVLQKDIARLEKQDGK